MSMSMLGSLLNTLYTSELDPVAARLDMRLHQHADDSLHVRIAVSDTAIAIDRFTLHSVRQQHQRL